MKRVKLFLCIVLLVQIVSLLSMNVSAVDTDAFDPNHACSITVTLAGGRDKTTVVVGAQVTVYQIANMSISDDEVVYTYCEGLDDCTLDLDYCQTQGFAELIAEDVEKNAIPGISLVTDEAGKAVFTNLKPGLYLVTETETVVDFAAFEPFILRVPLATEDAWVYDVKASPKIDDLRTDKVSVKKVWNDRGNNRPSSVTIRLMNGSEVYDTVVLSDENKWVYTWTKLPLNGVWSVEEVDVPKGYTVTYYENGLDFTVNNTEELIYTGQLNWPIPVLICGGVLLMVIGLVLKAMGRNRNAGKVSE